VSLQRTIVQGHEGERATVSDRYLSSDGHAHTLSLVSLEDAEEATAMYSFPWVNGGAYAEHKAGEVIPSPAAAPANVSVSFNNEADGSAKGAQGAITFSSAPNRLAFATTGAFGKTHLTASFERSVPAGGSATLAQVFSWAFTKAQAQTLAKEAEGELKPLAEQEEARELKERTEREARERKETEERETRARLEREARERAEREARERLASAPSAPAAGVLPFQMQKPPTASASITKSSFNGHELLVTIACGAGGANCSGELTAVAKVSVKQGHKTRVEQITVAKGSFSLPAGSSETAKLKLTRTATKELTRLGKLATTITAALTEPNQASTELTARLTLHKPHKH
jgi:hypothetical protein